MNVQIYALKRDFEVQKAERYFKERRIPYHFVDLHKHTLGLKELTNVKNKVGLRALIDEKSKAYAESTVRMMTGEAAILEELIRRPALLKMPIVRNGAEATVGYCPETWAKWA